jgi:ubiquinone/menaquinone biosynthesis C-methylase UbiE
VDYNLEFLSYVEKTAKERGIANIKAVHVGATTIELPECCDLVFMRNVYHHIAQPLEYMSVMKKYLKPGGRIAILDYKRTAKWSHTTLFGHYVDEGQLAAVMERAGYRLASGHDWLSEQSFNVFEIA